MMWKYILLLSIVMSILSSSESARTHSRRRRGYAGGYGGAYSGAGSSAGGHTGGYTGTGGYNDYDDYDSGFGGYHNFGIIDPYTFHQQLTSQILAQNAATQQAITGLATSGGAYASADASVATDDMRIQNQIAAQWAYHNNLVRQNQYHPSAGAGTSSYNSHRYAPSYALASGSISPSGHKQTAYISPASASTPNIVNRFGPSSSSGGGGGYKGVSVSSFSSSNSDGTGTRGAQTTINDNGKVTSYSVHS